MPREAPHLVVVRESDFEQRGGTAMRRLGVVSTGLALLLASIIYLGSAWAGGQRWADTGKVVAVTLASRTIVVEIPRAKDTLTVGAEVLPNAVIKAGNQTIQLSDIRVGDRVRIEWSRGEQGDVAHRIIVERAAK
jgi:ribosomal protein S17